MLVIVILLSSVLLLYFIKRIIETAMNIYESLKDKNKYDVTKQQNGFVYNEKTNKIEADQSLILPFE